MAIVFNTLALLCALVFFGFAVAFGVQGMAGEYHAIPAMLAMLGFGAFSLRLLGKGA